MFYDLSVFNRCAETDNVLLTIECWKDVNPGMDDDLSKYEEIYKAIITKIPREKKK